MPRKGERGGAGAQYYRAYLERPGPQNLGTVDWPKPKRGALEGQRFFSTGVMETIEREDLYSLIQGCSGITMTVVSKKLTYLIVGRDAGPVKLIKANEMEIPQIDEGGFYAFITETLNNYDEKDVKPKIEKAPKAAVVKKEKEAVKPKVKKEQNGVKPKVKKDKQDVKPKVKKEDVRSKVKMEKQDVKPKVKKEKAPKPPKKEPKARVKTETNGDAHPPRRSVRNRNA